MANLIALLGIAAVVGTAMAFSYDRRSIRWRTAGAALGLELLMGAIVFLTPGKDIVLDGLNRSVLAVLDCAGEGVAFVFGWLATPPEGKYSLAVQAFPTIIFFAALISLLYHVGFLQRVIRLLARLFNRLFGISGAEALAAASNIFVGIESALAVRPYLDRMTRSELFLVLTVGMATIASSVLGLYVLALKGVFPQIAVHLMSATAMSAPAAVCMAKLMCPETDDPLTLGQVVDPEVQPASNAMESILNGANEGVRMVLGIVAALIAFVGIVALVNLILTTAGSVPNNLLGVKMDWTLQGLLGYVFYPYVVLLGVPLDDAFTVARLIGDRLVLTEVGAYFGMAEMLKSNALDPRSVLVTSYVLCGFAHVASLAIFVGGTATLSPKQAPLLSRIGLRALVAANLACLLTGATASLFYHSGVQVLAAQ